MARGDFDRTVEQSIIERLTDTDPGAAADPAQSWAASVRQLKLAVRRDIEWLLNTRRTTDPVPEGCDELRRSLFRYGLPDLSAVGRDAPDTQHRLAREVEATITLFEPRLSGTRVALNPIDDLGARRLYFVVEAMLRMSPSPERVVFDTMFDVAKGEFEVRDGGAG